MIENLILSRNAKRKREKSKVSPRIVVSAFGGRWCSRSYRDIILKELLVLIFIFVSSSEKLLFLILLLLLPEWEIPRQMVTFAKAVG